MRRARTDLHAADVWPLLLDVHLTHVDLALKLHQGSGRGESDAVLAGSGLGNELLLAHLLCEQSLAQAVVDLVGARVVEVLPLEIDLGPCLTE